MKCHSCGNETDYKCESCGQPVCDDCVTPFTYHNQIDFAQCIDCTESTAIAHLEEAERNQAYEASRAEKRSKRNEAARRRYHSPAQKEKRRLKKIEERRKNFEDHKRFWETMTEGMPMFRD